MPDVEHENMLCCGGHWIISGVFEALNTKTSKWSLRSRIESDSEIADET